jgi:hypothetical protein
MEIISIVSETCENRIIPAVRNTIRFVPVIVDRKPSASSLLPISPVITDRNIKGCFVSRITKNTAPLLILLVTGEIKNENHRPQTRGIYFHNLETLNNSHFPFSLKIKSENYIKEYIDLTVESFELRGERGKALYIKIDVKGKTENITENSEDPDELIPERYFFLYGNEISVNGVELADIAGFTVEGKTDTDGVKLHHFSIRIKESSKSDFTSMRGEISVLLVFDNPDIYETAYKATFKIILEKCIYEGEESFPDGDGIWGRTFRYQVYGGIKITVYTVVEEI